MLMSLGKYTLPPPVNMIGGLNCKTIISALPQWLWQCRQTRTPSPTLSSTPSRALNLNATTITNDDSGGITTKAEEGMNENPIGVDQEYLQRAGLRAELMPKHVAVTLDGGRRWSDKYNNGRLTYVPFFKRFIMLGELCVKLGIPALSCFIFASCNWRRGPEFANVVFTELEQILEDNIESFKRKGTRFLIIGEKWRLPKSLQDMIKQVEEETKNGKTLDLIFAVAYGGRIDIVEATKSICVKVMDGVIKPEDIDEALVEQQLSNVICQVPNPDLMIRNGGKHRFSNFYLWQASHAELYFCDSVIAAEFGEAEFLNALSWFQGTNRRFGK